MSQLNGDRARFQKNRKRKLLYRQRVRLLVASLRKKTGVAGGEPSDPDQSRRTTVRKELLTS